MRSNIFKPVLTVLIILLGSAGLVLWFAAYFWGLLLLAGAGLLFYLMRRIAQDKETARGDLQKLLRNLFIPVAGIVAAIIIGAVLMAVTGYNPFEAYRALFYGGFVKSWSVSVLNATPLIFTGLSVAFAFKAGLFNIGAEGQYYVGAMAATFLGIYLKMPGILVIPLIFLISGAVAGAYNYIPALLKVRTGAHEVITTMMFAHIARYLSNVFIRNFGGNPETSSHPYVTWPIQDRAWLPRFQQFLPEANYRLHIGILIGILMALFVYYILYYTKFGFEIRAVGQNPLAARTQGISVGTNTYRALLFAGFLAGFAGVVQVIGLNHKLFQNLSAGYGWNGISVALLASNNPIGVVFTAILWGSLDAGGQYMSRTVQTPNSIVEIIKGIILFLVVARYIWATLGNKIRLRGRKQREAV